MNVTRMESLIDQVHGLQLRKDGSSNALHVKRVRRILLDSLHQTGEAVSDILALEIAALGHDLLEDTAVTKELITEIGGIQALTWIEGMTNSWGDDDTTPYVEQIIHSPEEVRLIKLADLVDNIFHASFSGHLLGVQWIEEFFLPIVDPMRTAVSQTNFTTYFKTATLLIQIASIARNHLEESLIESKKSA